MLLLLNGIGGIGKSTLASYYLNQHKHDFDYYGFVQVNEDIKLNLASAFSTSLDLKSEKIDDLFAEIMNKLQNLEGQKLLIIDDVKEMENQLDEINTLMTLKNSGFQILFTSREVKENIPQYFLDIMSIEDARELFLKYFPTAEIEKVDIIIKKYLDCHTLFIEMTAKTLIQKQRTFSLDKIIEKFKNGEFSTIKRNRKESFNDYLNDLFSFDKLDEEEILLLKQLSVLPSHKISFDNIQLILDKDNNEDFEDFLNPLAHTYQKLSRLDDARKTYELAVSISERIVEINSKARVFTYGNISNFYLLIEEYKLALNFLEQGFSEANRIYGTSDINKILSFYMSKANILMKYKGCKDAIPIYEKVIDIRVKYYGEEHLSVGEAFNNLGVCFSKEKVYDKAKMCLVKSLQIYMDFYKNKHPDMVSITMNLAEVLMFQDKKEEALTCYNNALDMSLAYWGENHLDTALVYYNFSKYHFKYQNYKKAKELMLKAIETQKMFLDSKNSKLLNSVEGLRLIENKLNIHKIKEGRNSPCSCGSGKKYKRCCGSNV